MIFVWMLIAALMFFGFIFFSVISVGTFVGILINLLLLPLRILLAVFRAFLGLF